MNNKMKKISKPLLLIAALCMWGGCKDDSLQGDGENGLTTVGTNYMAFNIVSDGGVSTRGTRAWPGGTPDLGEFDAGSPEEQAVTTYQGSNVAIFFNENGSFHSIRDLTRVLNTDGGTPHDRYENDTEVSVGTFVANLKLDEGSMPPSKVLVVLNGNPNRLDDLERYVTTKPKDEYKLPDGSRPKDDADYVLGYLTRRLSDEAIGGENSSIVMFSPSGIDNEYCTMTNSVYVGAGDKAGDEALKTAQTGAIYNLARIEEKNIQATEDLAKQADNLLTIHVERLAVKVEVDIDKEKMKPQQLGDEEAPNKVEGLAYPVLLSPTGDGAADNVLKVPAGGTEVTDAEEVKWAFSLFGWSTNAVARRMYLFKNLNDYRGDISGEKDASPLHHDGNNSITEPFFSYWNDAPRARCYWAVDGHYADPTVYPVQYRDAKDNTGTNSYKDMTYSESGDKTANMPLYYYSFTQMRMICMGLVPNANPDEMSGDGSDYTKWLQKGTLRKNLKYRYCGENVLGQRLIDDPNHIWRGAATHVVFFGQLLLGDEIDAYSEKCTKEEDHKITQELLESVSDKLYAGGCYWNRADYMRNAYTKIYTALTTSNRTVTDRFGGGDPIVTPEEAKLFYVKDGVETELTSDYFTKLIEEVTAKTLNDVHDQFDYTKDDCNGADETKTNCIFRLSAANVSNGDSRVMLGLKKGYTLEIKGKEGVSKSISTDQFLSIAYEFAGVADLYAHGRMYYYAPIYHNAVSAAAKGAAPVHVGDIGVVRNHWYKLTISSLLKPGIPVSDPGQPIIPNIDPTDRYLGLEIHVLPWHVIGQQVTLQ